MSLNSAASHSNTIPPIDTPLLDGVGKEDVNFPEFVLGVMDNKRGSTSSQELIFQDPLKTHHKIGIVPSGLGFPTQFDRDVYRALMKLTKEKTRFDSRDVPITRREISQLMGLPDNGSILKRIEKSLDLLTGVRIKFYNSYYDMEKKEDIEEVINIGILSSYRLDNRESRKKKKGQDTQIAGLSPNTVRWSKEFWNLSLKQARNLIDYDYSMYISLKGNITRELYIFLNKRAYSSSFFSIPLTVLAFEKLGMSRTQQKHLSKVRQMLRKAHAELMDLGFFSSEPIFHKTATDEHVQYSFAVRYSSQKKTNQPHQPRIPDGHLERLKMLLAEIGFTDGQVGKLYQKHDTQFLFDGLELLEMTKNVHNKKGWFLGYLKGGYDMTDLEQKRQEDAQKRQEKQVADTQARAENKAQSRAQKAQAQQDAQVDAWIASNPLEWIDMCRAYVDTQFEEESPAMYQALQKAAHKADKQPLEMFMGNRMYNYPLRDAIMQKLQSEE